MVKLNIDFLVFNGIPPKMKFVMESQTFGGMLSCTSGKMFEIISKIVVNVAIDMLML